MTHAASPRKSENTVRTEPLPVPFAIQREGEDAAPDNLLMTPIGGPGRYRLRYADEESRDRDLRGVLWARSSFGAVDDSGRLTGNPQWRMLHPCGSGERCRRCAARSAPATREPRSGTSFSQARTQWTRTTLGSSRTSRRCVPGTRVPPPTCARTSLPTRWCS